MIKTTMTALGMLALAGAAQAGGAKLNSVKQQVEVETTDGKVYAKVSVDNGSGVPVFVPKAVFQNAQLFRREFDIKDMTTRKEVDYIGPMVKRGPLTMKDFVEIKPGVKRSHSIEITRSYDFKPGKHAYQISYSGSYLADPAKVEASTPITVAPVTFSYPGK